MVGNLLAATNLAALLVIWERHGMKELVVLSPELRKMVKDLRLKELTDQKRFLILSMLCIED